MMSGKWFSRLEQSLGGAAVIIAVASIISRLFGLLRDRILLSHFGAGEVLDVYYSAFRVPDLLFNLLVLGALSASFIPVFLSAVDKHGRNEGLRMAGAVMNWVVLGLALIGGVAAIFSFPLASLMFPGASAAQQLEIAHFSRIMLISTVFFGVSNVASGVLQSDRRFLSVSLSPIVYNIGIIIGALWLAPTFGPIGLAYGVVLGALLHGAVQMPALFSTGFRFRAIWVTQTDALKTIFRLMIPRSLALGVAQLNIIILYAIASYLDTGSRAVWAAADNIQQVPINVFGVSLAVAAFPVFSAAFVKAQPNQFREAFSSSFRRILFFVIPLSVAILLLRAQIIRLVYGTGEFNWEDTYLTAQTLGAFSLSLVAQATIPLLARSFFAQQNTRTPVILSSIAVLINVGLALVLAPAYGIMGLALSFSVAALTNMVLLLSFLRVRFGDLDDDRIVRSSVNIILAAIASGIVIQGLKYFIAPIVDMTTFVGVFMQTAGAFLGGALTYMLITILLRFDEVRMIRKMLDTIRLAVARAMRGGGAST